MTTIYWGVNTNFSPEGIRAEAPISILQKISQERKPIEKPKATKGGIAHCPAINDELIVIFHSKDTVKMNFTQTFKSDTYSDIGIKELIWGGNGSDWRIFKETWLPHKKPH